MKNETMFKEWMTLFGEMFDKEISDSLKQAYWQIFQPFSDKQCEKAFKKVLATAKFFPKPADFLEHLQQGVPHILAWEMAFNALKDVGPYMSVKFSDAAIHLVIELMGGWPSFCGMENQEIKWKQMEFEKIYKGVCQRGKFPDYLSGIHESENLKTRHLGQDPPLVMSGEFAKRKMLDA